MRKLFLIALASLLAGPVKAHDVVWPGNENGRTPLSPIILRFIGDTATISVQPVIGETCTVTVTLDPIMQTLVRTTVSQPNPDLQVKITVTALRESLIFLEDVKITGEWHATGLPVNQDCTAVTPERFSVPILVLVPITFSQQPNSFFAGDPVSTSTGEFTTDAIDLRLGGPFPLSFARHYGSFLTTGANSSALGSNWMHNFDQRLQVSGTNATVFLYPGKVVRFQQSGSSWQIASTERFAYQLVSSSGTYQFLDLPNALIYTFSSAGALTSIRDRNSNTLTITSGAAGPISVSDGLGRTLSFTYAANLLSTVRDQTGRGVSFSYLGNNLASAADAIGRIQRYNYNAGAPAAQLSSSLMPAGNTPLTQTFDSGGRVVKQADSAGAATSISFSQPAAGSQTVTDPLGRAATHTYGSGGNLAQYTDPAGSATVFSYDDRFRLTSRTDSLGAKTTVTYHALSGFPSSITDGEGNTTTYVYTAQAQGAFTYYNLTQITLPDGTSVNLRYDNFGNLLSSTDRAGKVTTYTYNSRGQALTATNPAGGVVTMTYNADGTLATVRSPSGAITTFVYDALKRVAQLKFADNTTRSYTYDALDRPLTSTDERGKVTKMAYDANGNITSVIDPLNQASSATYDADDLLSSRTDTLGNTTRLQYDQLGSLAAATDAAGQTGTFSYDSLNRLKSAADSTGKGPTFSYDSEGRLTSVSDALSNTTSLLHDRVGRATRVITPLGESNDRTFDSMGRVTSASDPLGHPTTFSYDARGLLTAINGPEGITAAYTFDDLGRISGVTDSNGSTWAMKHDTSGRLASRTDPLGRTMSYAYDARNRVNGVTHPLGSAQVAFDAAGNTIQRTYSDGTLKAFTYDDNNRVTSGQGVTLAYDAAGRITSSNGIGVARDIVGRISSIAYSPDKVVSYTYDSRGLLTKVSDWANGSVAFAYDDGSRLITITRSNNSSTQFRYDANSRIAAISEASGDQPRAAITLQRDAAGKIISADRNLPQNPALAAGALTVGYDAAHQISGASYDSLGRLTGYGPRSYTWNLASELTGYSGSDGSASFGYDAFGLRTSATAADGTAQNYVLNYALSLPSIATVQSGGADQRYYVYLPGGALLYAIEAADNSHHFYHFDEIGSTTFLTDDSGAVSDQYGVTPYGETATAKGSTPNPFTWLGQWGVMQEGQTGLYYMRLRYYDSATARFLSRDPIHQLQPRGIDPYQYATANPMMNVDPTGLKGRPLPGLGLSGSSSLSNDGGGSFIGLWWPSDAGGLLSYLGIGEQALADASLAKGAAIASQWEAFAFRSYEFGMEGGNIRWLKGWFEDPWKTDGWWVKLLSKEKYMEMYEQKVLNSINTSLEARQAAEGILQAEVEASRLAKVAGFLKTAGTVLTVAGGVLQTGVAIYEDVNNHAGVAVTIGDAMGYVESTGALLVAPQLAIPDLLTGGAISGGIHNAVEAEFAIPSVVFTRTNSQEAAAIKHSMTKTWATNKVWGWGESLANSSAGEAVTTWLSGWLP